jgi:hypothetical protein
MPTLEPKAFARARHEYGLAASKFDAMRSAATATDLELYWSEFLTHIQRAFLKLKKASERGAAKGWFHGIEHTRTTDEMLSYIRHARNADEHGIERITSKLPGGPMIVPKEGNMLHIGHMEMTPFGVKMDPETEKNSKWVFIPSKVLLASVRDRGADYAVPRNHLGTPIGPATPLAVAELALKFLADTIVEAHKR